MNRKQKTKLISISVISGLLMAVAALVLYAFRQGIDLYYTPSQLAAAHPAATQSLRIGGYVKKGSVIHTDNTVNFTITDFTQEINVHYHGLLPSLFREGQGVVITGHLENNHEVLAKQVLAKHDENYKPPLLAKDNTNAT